MVTLEVVRKGDAGTPLLCGSADTVRSGTPEDVLSDLTPGVSNRIPILQRWVVSVLHLSFLFRRRPLYGYTPKTDD